MAGLAAADGDSAVAIRRLWRRGVGDGDCGGDLRDRPLFQQYLRRADCPLLRLRKGGISGCYLGGDHRHACQPGGVGLASWSWGHWAGGGLGGGQHHCGDGAGLSVA